MYRLICQNPAHFFSVRMAVVSTIFQMFIVLGMYNFGVHIKMMARTIYNYSENGFFAHYFLKINNALSCDKFKKGFGQV